MRTIGQIDRFDAAFDTLVPSGAEIEVLAEGFSWSEGPVWVPQQQCILFSDIPNNRIHRWSETDGLTIYMEPSGYTSPEPFNGPEPGSNGLTLDHEGRLVLCCHGDRAIKRQEKDGRIEVLATHFQGQRFNSPNDLVYHSSGDLYFTDPAYGLPKSFKDPAREMDWCGVFRLTPQGDVLLATDAMSIPNGLVFSPDENILYIGQSDHKVPVWRAFEVGGDGTLGPPHDFFDASEWIDKLPGSPDGMTVDQSGHVWATGPGGVLVITPSGKMIGRINTGERTSNCTFGDDGSTLYMTVDSYLCRLRTQARGCEFS